MATRINLHRLFEVDGVHCSLAAGVKGNQPLVVLGIMTLPYDHLANATIEYPMKSEEAATAFVVKADEDVIRRGLAKYRDEVEDVARRVNEALARPFNPHGYKTRGHK